MAGGASWGRRASRRFSRARRAAHVKDFLTFLRLADNGADELAWFRALQLVEGVGPVSARRAIAALSEGWERAREALLERARAGADAVVAAIEAAREQPEAGVRAEGLRDALAP